MRVSPAGISEFPAPRKSDESDMILKKAVSGKRSPPQVKGGVKGPLERRASFVRSNTALRRARSSASRMRKRLTDIEKEVGQVIMAMPKNFAHFFLIMGFWLRDFIRYLPVRRSQLLKMSEAGSEHLEG